MKKSIIHIVICLLPFGQAMAVDTEALTHKSRAAIKALGAQLKNTLQTSMKTKGPIIMNY